MIKPKILSDEVNRIADFVFELDTLTGIETDERDHLKTAVIEGMKAQNDYCYKEMLKQLRERTYGFDDGKGMVYKTIWEDGEWQAIQGLEG